MASGRPIPQIPYAPASGHGELPAEALWLSEVWKRRLNPPLDRPQRIGFDLLMLAEGRGQHMVDFEVLEVRAGDILLVPRGSAQRYIGDRRFEARLLLLPPGGESPLSGLAATRHRPSRSRCALIRRLHDELVDFSQREPGARGDRVLFQLALAVFAAALPDAPLEEEDATSAVVRRFEALARRSLPAQRRVQWYAEQLGCSARTLQRACDEERDRSPKELLDEVLVTEARRALLDDTVAIADVAEQIGFSEPTNFTKWFKRVTGTTPLHFRRTTLEAAAVANACPPVVVGARSRDGSVNGAR